MDTFRDPSPVANDARRVTVADPSLAHVLGRLQVLEQVVAAAVKHRRATEPGVDDRFRGLWFPEAELDRLLATGSPLPARDEAAERRFAEVEAAADAAEQAGADLRLRRLA